MDLLKLDAESVSEMKAFYQEELSKALRRIDHINKILSQLGESGARLELHVNDSSSSSKSSLSKRKYKKKRGPKSKWDKVIIKSLKQADKPLTYDELTNYLMISEGRPPAKRKNTKATVQNTVFRLRQEKKLQTFSMGSRIKYIALSSWTEDGEVKEEFKSRVSLPKKAEKPGPKPKKRGPGRPPKKRGPGRPPKAKSATSKKKPASSRPKEVSSEVASPSPTPVKKAKTPAKKKTIKAKKAPGKSTAKPKAAVKPKSTARSSAKPKAKKKAPAKAKSKASAKAKPKPKPKPKAASQAKAKPTALAKRRVAQKKEVK